MKDKNGGWRMKSGVPALRETYHSSRITYYDLPAAGGCCAASRRVGVERNRAGRASQGLCHAVQGVVGERDDLVLGSQSLRFQEGRRGVLRSPGHDERIVARLASDRVAVGAADDRE